MGSHDRGYKHLFSFPVMVEDLLKGFVGEAWVDDLDFTTLERRNGSYVSDDLAEREDDIIWRIKWKGEDRWIYVYFLIEFQTEHDQFMAVRMMSYLGLLYQDLIKTEEIHAGDPLPPVLPMVIYRGDVKWRTPQNIKNLIQTPPPGLSRYLPSLRYLLLEEARMNDADLEKMCNLVAEIFRIEISATLKASIPPFISFLKWTQKAGAQQDSLKRAAFVWYHQAQRSAKLIDDTDDAARMAIEEIEPMLSERVEQWSKQLREEGRAEGEAKGRAEGEIKLREVAQRLLATGMATSKVAELTGLVEAEVSKLQKPLSQ